MEWYISLVFEKQKQRFSIGTARNFSLEGSWGVTAQSKRDLYYVRQRKRTTTMDLDLRGPKHETGSRARESPLTGTSGSFVLPCRGGIKVLAPEW